MSRIKITCIAGARPNFVKMAAVLEALRENPAFEVRLIHTGQHYSAEMSEQFFRELELPRADVNLEVGSGTRRPSHDRARGRRRGKASDRRRDTRRWRGCRRRPRASDAVPREALPQLTT